MPLRPMTLFTIQDFPNMDENRQPINIRLEDKGTIDGIHVVEVYNANTNELIGKNESFVEEETTL